jgi:hypothetical protein
VIVWVRGERSGEVRHYFQAHYYTVLYGLRRDHLLGSLSINVLSTPFLPLPFQPEFQGLCIQVSNKINAATSLSLLLVTDNLLLIQVTLEHVHHS